MSDKPRFDTHVCLVSGQATPNLTPVLDPSFAPKHVVLLVSADMGPRAKALGQVMKRHGVTLTELPVIDAYDYFGVEETLLNWVSQHDDQAVALNVTGGTKVMAMAAQEVFRAVGKPVFYVNIDSDQVLFLGQRQSGFRLEQRVRLREYLEANGYGLDGTPAKTSVPAWERDLCEKLAYDLGKIGAGLGELNRLAQEAKGTLKSPVLSEAQRDSKQLDELIDRFSEPGLVQREGRRLVFRDESARGFINGGWLERHVYRVLADLAPELGLSDYAVGLQVVAPDKSTRNELDVAFLHRNRLHLIECKTANLGASGTGGASKGTDALYKLETLLKMGGLTTRGMLIDYRGSLSRADLDRARQGRIEVVSGHEVRNLKRVLEAWVAR